MPKKHNIFVVVVVCVCLMFTVMIPGYAKQNQVEVLSSNSANSNASNSEFPIVPFASGSKIELKEIYMLPSLEGNVVSFTLDFYNGETKELLLIDYWVKLKTKTGSEFSVNMIQDDERKVRISSHTSQKITFYTIVPENLELDDFQIELIEWDFSLPDYQRILGIINIPDSYDPAVPFGNYKSVETNNIELNVSIDSFQLSGISNRKKASVYLNAINLGYRSVDIPEFKYYIQTSEKLLYSIDKFNSSNNAVQPRELKSLLLQGYIPEGIETDVWRLVLAVEEQSGIDRAVAVFEMKEEYKEEAVIPHGEKYELLIDEIPALVWIEEANNYRDGDHHQLELKVMVENIGNDKIELPEYRYYIKTGEAIRYPLSVVSETKEILPRFTEEIELETKVPSSISLENWQLMIEEFDDEADLAFPIVTFAIRLDDRGEKPTDGIPLGQTYEYVNEHGKYGIRLISLQRLPWNHDDIISAEFVVSNLDDKTLPLPNVIGMLELDGIALADNDVKTIVMDRLLALRQNQSTRYMVISKIPYTYEYDEIVLKINEDRSSDSNDKLTRIADFVYKSRDTILKPVAVGDTFEIRSIGQRAAIGIRNVHVYEEANSRIYYVEVDIQNQESRQSKIPPLAGYLKTTNDLYFPVEVQEVEHPVAPYDKSLIAVYSRLPYGVPRAGMQLVLGEKVDMDEDYAIVQASLLDLPSENREQKLLYEDIEIYPYTISFTNMSIRLTGNAQVNFQYELERSRTYQSTPEGHKLVMVLMDGETPYEQTFEFEKDLLIGTHNGSMTANMDIGDPIEKIQESNGFEVRVYDEFEGHRKLLAAQRILLVTSGNN